MRSPSSSFVAAPDDPGPGRTFVVGANLPWINYGTDFGASAWYPEGGLSVRPAALDRLHEAFAALGRDGITVVRAFLLCDGRSGILYDDGGLPVGLDDSFFSDVDALLAAARAHNLRVMPVLFDFHLCAPMRLVNEVQVGGRAHLFGREARRALIDRVLAPLFGRYGEDATVEAWDLINEPEWCLRRSRVFGLPRGFGRPSVSFSELQGFLQDAVRCARGSARQPITVGSAGTWCLDLVRPVGLDFYQIHWYERFGWAALERPVALLDLDRPVILGEFSGARTRRGVARVLDTAEQAGYRGALVWSVLADDEQSGYPPEIVAWIRERERRISS
jgi:hypothetical protein